MLNFKIKFFINELLAYFFIQIFGLLSAKKILSMPEISHQIQTQQISWLQIIMTILFGTLLLLLILKFVKPRTPYKIFFGFLFFLGAFYALSIWLPFILALGSTVAIFIVQRQRPKIIFHNLIIILTIVWAAVYLGLVISPWQMVVVLLILSVYDMIAVWKTKHMVKMFKGLAERGVVFAIILPTRIQDLLKPIPAFAGPLRRSATPMRQRGESFSEARAPAGKPERNFLFMGTGDFALPMIFAVSALSRNIWSAILVIIGALLGIIFIHFVFLIRKERKPLPALPPLAVGAILGWLIAGLI